jgi:hypothetical protein
MREKSTEKRVHRHSLSLLGSSLSSPERPSLVRSGLEKLDKA